MSGAIIKAVDRATGKESTQDKGFVESNWGPITRDYLVTIKKLTSESFAKIASKAQAFTKLARQGDITMVIPIFLGPM
jgi:hypothetical protein